MGISRGVGPFIFSFVVALSSACSSNEQHPSQIGDCTGPANSCIGGKVGAGSGSGSSDDGGGCGALMFIGDCGTCAETNCCSFLGLCSSNTDCLSLAACIGACATQSCATDCQTAFPNAVADDDAVNQCLLTSCSVECGVSDAGASPVQTDAATSLGQSCGRFSYQSVSCQTCVEGGCCDAAEMCSDDPDCFLYMQCLSTCASMDAKCKTDCQTTNALGFTNSSQLNLCIVGKCSTQCQ